MKLSTIVSSLLIAALVLVSTPLHSRAASEPADKTGKEAKATIIVKIGIVKVTREGTSEEIHGKKGMLLYPGDSIKTGELSRAALILNDGTITKLHEKTNLVLMSDKKKEKSNRLKLLLGQLWAKVKKQKHSLEIETPSAVAAIKGTEFELKSSDDGRVELVVWAGLIEFFNSLGKVQVGASQKSTVYKDKTPAKPETVDLSKQDQWFESVIEIPSAKELNLKIKDKDGKTQELDIKYKKK